MGERSDYWDDTYRTRGVSGVSWYQPEPTVSLELVRLLGVGPADSVIDVGGGASMLVDHLVAQGFTDISVLDVSGVALEAAKRRLGSATAVDWLHEDLLCWRPTRRFGLWHDRAVFHFLTDEADRARYFEVLTDATEPGGAVILAAFADDGPEQCSGLPVARYSAAELERALGTAFLVLEARRELHTTPTGAAQPFTWVAARAAGRGRATREH